jgi:hypothetical protein
MSRPDHLERPMPIALNPKRIKATESVREGEVSHFRGKVTLDVLSLTHIAESWNTGRTNGR